MTSPTIPAARTTRRLLLVAGAVAAAVPALAAVASADEPAEAPRFCRTVAGDDLGRDDGTHRVEIDGSGLALVRERDQLRLEGDAPGTSLTVVDDDGWTHEGWLVDGVLREEVNRTGYVQVEVCWRGAAVVPAEVGTVPTPAVVEPDPEPEQPPTTVPVVPVRPDVTARPAVVLPETEPTATTAPGAPTPTSAGAPAPASPATPAPAAPRAAAPRLAVTGAPVGPLAALSGGVVALGAGLVVLRARAHRARRDG